jgi:hypothetical protein
MSGRLGGVAPVKLGSRSSRIAVPTVGIGMLVVLAIGEPMQAQSDQGLPLGFPACERRVNLQDNSTSDATLRFAVRRTAAVAASDGISSENEALTLAAMSNPFAALRQSWGGDFCNDSFSVVKPLAQSGESYPETAEGNKPGRGSKETSTAVVRDNIPTDRDRSIYYKNKLELSLEGGWLPINIPFPFDFLFGSGYNFSGLYYTLVPIVASVRWQLNDVGSSRVWRGNWDVTFSGSITAIPRGPETRYFSYMMGIRRNFVPCRWTVMPYFDGQLGLGEIDAKGPLGVAYAQGQNFTFTLNLGSGARYNFNPRYGIQAGMHYMHISNLYLSEPKFLNYGINVYGPWVGIDIRLDKHQRAASH